MVWSWTELSTFIDDETGATSIEYALIASVFSVAVIPAVNSLGAKISATFTKIAMAMDDAPPAAPAAAGP